MKKRLLQIASLLMALVVSLVSVGWDVQFHYCSAAHEVSSSLNLATESCSHCHNHGDALANNPDQLQLSEKSCCTNFESKIQFTDDFLRSFDHHVYLHLQPFVAHLFSDLDLVSKARQSARLDVSTVPLCFLSGKERLLFFSSLRLNPLVF